jgi:hypothetical protein
MQINGSGRHAGIRRAVNIYDLRLARPSAQCECAGNIQIHPQAPFDGTTGVSNYSLASAWELKISVQFTVTFCFHAT